MSEIRTKKPKVGAGVAGLSLTSEERLVIARIDGRRSIGDLGVGDELLDPLRGDFLVAEARQRGHVLVERSELRCWVGTIIGASRERSPAMRMRNVVHFSDLPMMPPNS